MIYTSYFGNVGHILKLSNGFFSLGDFISISRYDCKSVGIKSEKNLAPSLELLWKYKLGNINWKEYSEEFYNNMYDLEWLFWKNFEKKFDGKILLCYEKNYKKCHRYLVGKFYKWWSGKDLVKEITDEDIKFLSM